MKGINRVSADALKEAVKISGVSKYRFAKNLMIFQSNLHYSIKHGCSKGYIQRIAQKLNLSITEFLILGEEPETKRKILHELVDELSKEEKEELKKRL